MFIENSGNNLEIYKQDHTGQYIYHQQVIKPSSSLARYVKFCSNDENLLIS